MALTRATKSSPARPKEIKYPVSDGKPLGESAIHIKVTALGLLDVIMRYYDANPRVAVHSNMFIYYVEGDPKRVICPDLFVALDVPSSIERLTYKVWVEGKAPDLAIEVTSKKTRREDLGKKFELYRDVLKVREYFMFDPLEDYLTPSLQGFRLTNGQYNPIAASDHGLPSEVLGLHLERDGTELRLYNPRTGLWELTSEELKEALEMSEAKTRELETAKRDAESRNRDAEAEIERLRRELDALRKK